MVDLLAFNVVLDLVDDDDEILLNLAESLGNFLDYIGGPSYVTSLFPPLELLCATEESSVRDKAVEMLKKILSQVKIKDLETEILSLIKKMNNGDWYTTKMAAASLIPTVYPFVSPGIQNELMMFFTVAANDDVPQVRKAAASSLKDILTSGVKVPEAELLSIFGKLTKDNHDSVRLQGIENCVAFAKILVAPKVAAYLLPFIKSFAEDKSWRIRYLAAEKIVDLCNALGVESARANLFPYYCSFLADTESEVRTAAVKQVANICTMINPEEIIKKIIPSLKKLSADTFHYVRAALAENFLSVCPLIGKSMTIEHIIPIFLALLKDENPDVRLNLFKKLEELNKVIGIETLAQNLVPAITELAQDKGWRVRLTVIQNFPVLAKQLDVPFFSDKFGGICLSWLNDPVYAIREAAIENLKELTQILGPSWTSSNVLSKVMSYQAEHNYLTRLNTLFASTALASVLTSDILVTSVVPGISQMVNDKVPNIRMNVAKSLGACSKQIKDTSVNEKIKTLLKTLASDSDFDVRYYAKKAIESM